MNNIIIKEFNNRISWIDKLVQQGFNKHSLEIISNTSNIVDANNNINIVFYGTISNITSGQITDMCNISCKPFRIIINSNIATLEFNNTSYRYTCNHDSIITI